MKTDSLRLSVVVPTDPATLWAAWLDGERHAAMTGAPATGEPRVGARFTAWEGYIEGETLELEPPRRIVQSWRTSEFPVGAPSARLELELIEVADGTQLTLVHTRIPAGQGERYETGWEEFYFAPMRAWFGRGAR